MENKLKIKPSLGLIMCRVAVYLLFIAFIFCFILSHLDLNNITYAI